MVVRELMSYKAPPILILVCLLTIWNTQLHHKSDRNFLEVFAGRGEITRALRAANLRGAAIDIDHHPAFDLTTPAGFVHYTRAFGEFIAEQVKTRRDVPIPALALDDRLPTDLTDLELFRKFCMPFHETDRWEEAKMMDVLGYLGPCKHTNPPGNWETILHELFLR